MPNKSKSTRSIAPMGFAALGNSRAQLSGAIIFRKPERTAGIGNPHQLRGKYAKRA